MITSVKTPYYGDLSAAIIEQSVRDYEEYLRKYQQSDMRSSDKGKIARRIKEIEHFFKSEWYENLTELCKLDIEGAYIIKVIRERVRHTNAGNRL